MKRIIALVILLTISVGVIFSQEKKEIVKTGFNFGPLPVVAFDADRGFQYGALLNIYDFKDGASYPQPFQQWYFEASAYTKGSQLFVINYDSKFLIPDMRISVAATLNNEQAVDFYGFNGYQSFFDYERLNAGNYTPYYRFRRMVPNFKTDIIGKITNNFYWEAGYHFGYWKIGNVDLDKINKGKPEEEKFFGETLFQQYKKWGIIPENEAEGGFSSALRLGLLYDTRDFEAAPSKGIWAESHLILAPKFLGTSHPYARYSVTMRQYFPLMEDDLVFAYRINYQGTIGKSAPFYVLPYLTTVGLGNDRDAIGGYRSVRGLIRNRVQALDAAFFNSEIRWKFIYFQVAKQNISLGLSAFFDGAMSVRSYDMSYRGDANDLRGKAEYDEYMSFSMKEVPHWSAGGGFRFIMNRNFIVAIEYGMPLSKFDGKGSLYINTGYLF